MAYPSGSGKRRWGRTGQEEGEKAPSGSNVNEDVTIHDAGSERGKGRGKNKGKSKVFTEGKGSSLCTQFYTAGRYEAFMKKYQDDLDRLYARADLPSGAHWVDSHCHLESILARTWRGGGKPQVLDNEPLLGLPELVSLWPPGLDGCISNFAFRRPSKPGFPPEWDWLKQHLTYFEAGSSISNKLWFTIGIHPHDARNWDKHAEEVVRRYSTHTKCVGIGECGLDFFKHTSDEAELQLRAFRAQAAIAVEVKKALVVHGRLVTRENEHLCFRTLQEVVPKEHPIHIHCFSDSVEHALELCDHWPNLRIGFTGAITFRDNPAKGKSKGKGGVEEKKGEKHCMELVKGIPLERMLIETDGPYMCPDPFRGQTAHPGHVHRVAEKIAAWQGKSLGEVMAATRQSTKVVYGI
eukprot:gnl/MRDRNA2_/MRDRNA2_159635_c0_seq1.p1 gnl/MRDRNA2_/MRDRNA2_159635_c0~~gnl/MRDRNA2_/MRDRNA2_159635_c0_seq1.p1  ORF type:complete len:421 (+),score=77.36 gnl/MRDRNA2_/MRDRNA2_159635_c0_seq1:42-1265(+)